MVNQKQEDVDPRDCMYRLGNAIRKRITKALANDNVDQESKRQIEIALEKEEENKQLINYETLTIIHKHLQRIDITYNDYFFEFMDQCKIVAPPSRKNKELDSRLKKLKCQQSNKEYSKMVGAVNREKSTAGQISSFASEFRTMKPILITLFNSILVIGGTFVFCYKAVEYALPKPQVTVQVLFGLIGSSIVAIAEIYFLVRII